MNLFYDESGDLGFSFDQPYRHGGSSRYLTIGFALLPQDKSKYIIRLVRALYKRMGSRPTTELKAKDLTPEDKIWFAERVVHLVGRNRDIHLFAITIKKQNVQPHIRIDPNKLYNYATHLAIKDRVKQLSELHLYPDPRSIKVRSGNSHVDYLQTTLWFQDKSAVHLIHHQIDSKDSKQIQFVDYVTNIVWGHYEDGHTEPFDLIKKVTFSHTLFF